MAGSGRLPSRAIALGVILVLMLVAPLMLTRCNQQAGTTDPAVRIVLVKPAPTRGGSDARFERGQVTGVLPVFAPSSVAPRLLALRELCASLPALEKGPLGRLTQSDADAIDGLLQGLPYRDINQRIDWAKPIIGSDTYHQESLVSGGQSFGVFRCTDELAAAVAWRRAAQDWEAAVEECRRWGQPCLQQLADRFKHACADPGACASGMRWSEVSQLQALVERPVLGAEWTDPFTGPPDGPIAKLVAAVSEAKLAQQPP